MTRIPVPDVVVLLPGITGSILEKDGKPLWAPTAGAVLRSLVSGGGALKSLAVAEDDGEAEDLGDGVRATKVMDDVHLIPGLWKIDGYTGIREFLTSTFDLNEGENFFAFPYDWRRDNRASARRLQQEAGQWLSAHRVKSGNDRARLVLIGHSMGGLVSRYYVEALGGWADTRAVITFGTPFYGSLNAVDFLLHGFRKRVGPFEFELSDLIRSFRSIHQLVPSYRCINTDGVVQTPRAAQMPGWDPAWDLALAAFQTEVEAAAHANRADPAFARNPVVYRPIVGTDQPTRQSAVVAGGTVALQMTRGTSDEGGDGTVPALSAALSGTEDQRTFAPEQHGRLQNHESLLAHLKGVLSSLYQVRIEDLRATKTSWFSYRGDDLLLPGEPLTVELKSCSNVDAALLSEVEARLEVRLRGPGIPAYSQVVKVPREPRTFEIGVLPPGVYDVQVAGLRDSSSLSDVVAVVGEEDLP